MMFEAAIVSLVVAVAVNTYFAMREKKKLVEFRKELLEDLRESKRYSWWIGDGPSYNSN